MGDEFCPCHDVHVGYCPYRTSWRTNPGDSDGRDDSVSVRTPSSSCPKCGAGLVRRTNKKTLQVFLGCSSFTRGCRYTESLPDDGLEDDSDNGSLDDLAREWGFSSWRSFDESRE